MMPPQSQCGTPVPWLTRSAGYGLPQRDAVAAVDAAVQLEHVLAPGRLMQAVDILRDDCLELALTLQLRQTQVGAVGLGPVDNELVPVESVILLRVRS